MTRLVTTSSARVWLPASTISSRATGSIQTSIAACLVKAIGSSSSTTSSFRSRVSRLPGLRPVACSIWAARSSMRRLTTEAGSSFFSVWNFISHWPPTISSSGAWASPRGSTQPTASGWVALQGTKRWVCRPVSRVPASGAHAGPMR